MKACYLVFALVLCGAMAWAQTTTPQTPPAGGTTETGAGQATSTQAPSGQPTRRGTMQQQHMQKMLSELDQMRTMVQKMRTDAGNIQDSSAKTAALDNADLWDKFLNSMQQHLQGMQKMMGTRPGGMRGHGMMGKPPGATSQQPPPSTTPK